MSGEERQHLLAGAALSQDPSSSRCIPHGRSCLTRLFDVFPARYGVVLASCLGFVNVFSLRIDLSLAIVAMVKTASSPNDTTHHHHHVCTKLHDRSLSTMYTLYV